MTFQSTYVLFSFFFLTHFIYFFIFLPFYFFNAREVCAISVNTVLLYLLCSLSFLPSIRITFLIIGLGSVFFLCIHCDFLKCLLS